MFGVGYSPQEFWSYVHPSSCDVEVMQFTGLHEKNGVEIYEGDVVVFDVHPHNHDDKYIGVVTYCEVSAGFCVGEDMLYEANYAYLEVIGNIYENPELLEQPMKYKYGVEYETNGEKPDLGNGVVVKAWGDSGEIKEVFVRKIDWSRVKRFMVTDVIYKPKEKDMNDWYEKGDWPPVGTQANARYIPNEVVCDDERVVDGDCIICGYYDDMVWLRWKRGENFINKVGNFEFRPLRTETDRLVDEAELDIRSLSPELDRQVIRRMIDAGYRKIKLMSEGEFVGAMSGYYDDRASRAIYSAGCRFLDKGKQK